MDDPRSFRMPSDEEILQQLLAEGQFANEQELMDWIRRDMLDRARQQLQAGAGDDANSEEEVVNFDDTPWERFNRDHYLATVGDTPFDPEHINTYGSVGDLDIDAVAEAIDLPNSNASYPGRSTPTLRNRQEWLPKHVPRLDPTIERPPETPLLAHPTVHPTTLPKLPPTGTGQNAQFVPGNGGGGSIPYLTPRVNHKVQLASTFMGSKPVDLRRQTLAGKRLSDLTGFTNGSQQSKVTTFAHQTGKVASFKVPTSAVPNYSALTEISLARTHSKSERMQMSHADKSKLLSAFINKKVLTGERKLTQLNITALIGTKTEANPEVLNQLYNLSQQVDRIKEHLQSYDMDEVFGCVITEASSPEEILRNGAVTGEFYDIFTEYIKLTPKMIEKSTVWFLVWAGATAAEAEAYKDDVACSLQFLHSNTDPKLWEVCSQDLKKYSPAARGGPLMLHLLLRRIHQTNSQAVAFVEASLRSFKITLVEGENIEQVVAIIEAAIKVLVNAATPTEGPLDYEAMTQSFHFPTDLPLVVLSIMQTSSVPVFNEQFSEIQRKCEQASDEDETSLYAAYPPVASTLRIATNAYRRLIAPPSKWLKPSGTKRSAFQATGTNNPSGQQRTLRCWNCGRDHNVRDCTEPRDEAKIAANRERFNASRRRNSSRPTTSGNSTRSRGAGSSSYTVRQCRVVDGQPQVKNKLNQWVPDQKLMSQQKKQQAALAAVTADVTSLRQVYNSAGNKTVSFQVPASHAATAISSSTPSSAVDAAEAAWDKCQASLAQALSSCSKQG